MHIYIYINLLHNILVYQKKENKMKMSCQIHIQQPSQFDRIIDIIVSCFFSDWFWMIFFLNNRFFEPLVTFSFNLTMELL